LIATFATQPTQLTMTTIIIEDEKPAARLLGRKLEKLGVTVSTMLHSVQEAKGWFLENEHPDSIFLTSSYPMACLSRFSSP
jgi:DNA-binding response OmpR family regulator